MAKQNLFRLIFSLVICQLAGLIGYFFTAPAIPVWYVALIKPDFTPPSRLFGPVWIILYLLMGIALYLVWAKKGQNATLAVNFFLVHLFFNAFWPVLFFGLQSPYLGLLGIIVLWLMILYLIVWFERLRRSAAYLLIPYLLWVSFALLLNYYFWLLN